MRIISLSDYGYPVGGAESYRSSVNAALSARGHEVLRVSSNSTSYGTEFSQSDRQLGHSGHCFDLDGLFHPGNFMRLKRVLAAFKPDLVHFHNFTAALSPSVLYAVRGIPSAMTLHDYQVICAGDKTLNDGSICTRPFGGHCRDGCLAGKSALREKTKRAIIRRGISGVELLIAPSHYVKEQFEQNGYKAIEVLPHPHGVMDSASASSRSRSFLYLGRLAGQKGLLYLIEAMSILSSKNNDAQLLLAGKGPLESVLRAKVSALGLETRVQFLGWVDAEKKGELLQTSLCTVLPSIWPEVAGLTMYEAAAYGTPSIGSRVGGIPEFIKDEINGALVPPRDAKALAEKMRIFLENPRLVEKLSAAALQDSRNYTMERHVTRLEELFRTMLQRGVAQ